MLFHERTAKRSEAERAGRSSHQENAPLRGPRRGLPRLRRSEAKPVHAIGAPSYQKGKWGCLRVFFSENSKTAFVHPPKEVILRKKEKERSKERERKKFLGRIFGKDYFASLRNPYQICFLLALLE